MRRVLLCQFSLDAGTLESEVATLDETDTRHSLDVTKTATATLAPQEPHANNYTERPDASAPEKHSYSSPEPKPHSN